MVKQRAFKPERWHYVFMSALLASGSALPAIAQTTSATAVQEVIVTATKRSENLQSVPISVQALTPKVLAQQHVSSFDDYAKLLPSVSFQSFGPGQSQPYFRGITSGSDGLHSGSSPGTGVYIDETPVTTVAAAVDLHMYDIARVEALSGPQGTLFGANSLSGTLRIITNQPDPSAFSAAADVQGDTYGHGGGAGGVVEGYVNVPVSEKAAIRLVAFDEHDGGYIDNVQTTRHFQTLGYYNAPPTPGSDIAETNAKYVKNNFNTTDTYGGRAALKVNLDDHWTINPSIIYQDQSTNGNFLYNPRIGDLKTSDFAQEYTKDKWYQAALTIQGKLANWDVLYSGGYFDRRVDRAYDYSYYSVAYNALAHEPGYSSYASVVTFPDGHGGYIDPDQQFVGHDTYTKETHELRLSSPTDQPLRGVGGIFYERQTDLIIAKYEVPGAAAAGDPRAIPGAGDSVYYTNIHRIDRDFALFGEASYDILPDLTATVGGRYFTVDNTLSGVSGTIGAGPFARGTTEYGETHKVNLSWKIDRNHMIYATYSTGFRPGGVNRRTTLGNPVEQISNYVPDTITNYEVGAKTTWLDGTLRINGAIFDEEWHNLQYGLSPTGAFGVTAIFNVGYARSKGVEGDIVYHPDQHWTLSASGTALDARLTQTFCAQRDGGGNCTNFAYSGAKLPIQPPYKVNATARYEFAFKDYKNFVQASVQTQGDTTSSLLSAFEAALGPTKGFTTFDLSGGFGKDNWTVEAFAQNLFDERGILSKNTDCVPTYCAAYELNYPIKPQFFGIKVGAKY